MKSYRNDELIQLLSDDDASFRMMSLHFLCEAYAEEPELTRAVFDGWDRWGPATAFTEFPMLSYFPVAAEQVEESCQRAAKMVTHRALKDPVTRCAGKLMEQVVKLPARDLQSHGELLERTTVKSKIFFRVDLPAVRSRIDLLGRPADELAQLLDESVQKLSEDPSQARLVHQALHALEALRREHPETLDLGNVLRDSPPDDGPQAISFQLTIQSLGQLPQSGLEASLARHLHDPRESVHSAAVEALVRSGTPAAGDALAEQFAGAAEGNQRWIARGLQRIRAEGLAPKIAELRTSNTEHTLQLMLLIAELRQLDVESIERVTAEVSRAEAYSKALIDAGSVFGRLNSQCEEAPAFWDAFKQYLQQASQSLQQPLEAKRKKLLRSDRRSRTKARREVMERYRRRQ